MENCCIGSASPRSKMASKTKSYINGNGDELTQKTQTYLSPPSRNMLDFGVMMPAQYPEQFDFIINSKWK